MMGNMSLEGHPYYQKFLYQLRSRIQYWSSNGAITPQELQIMCVMAQNPGQQTISFIQHLGVAYPNGITEEQMRNEIDNTYLPQMRNAARQRLAMSVGMNGGMPGMGMSGLTFSRPVEPMSAFGSSKSMAAGLFGEMRTVPATQTPTQPQQQQQQPAPTTKLPEKKPWKCPEFDSNSPTAKFSICNCVNVLFGKFILHDSGTCMRFLIDDPRLRYTCDKDVLSAYQNYFKSFHNEHKFATIHYKQLMCVPVGREEMIKLANEIALTTSKIDSGLADRLKAIVSIIRGSRYSFACSEAYNNLFCDEFDMHMQCGELTTKSNPKMILNKFNSISEIADFVGKDIDKNTVSALESIPDYYKTLNKIVDDIVYDLALNFAKRIVNPLKQLSSLGSYIRAVPPIWSSDTDVAMHGTEDLIELWVMSNVQVSGSKSDGAVAAGSQLQVKIEELDKQFTVFWTWRTVSWTDYPASSVVTYNEKGECQPKVWPLNGPKSDVEFFVAEILKAIEEGNDAAKKRIPRSIYMEFEETTFSMNYGWTVDANLWLGCSRYWK